MADDCRITSVSPNGNVGSPEIGATSHETGSPGVGALGPDLPIRAPECPPLAGFLADFTFRARVGGILEGQVYLMGTDARDLWVPLPDGNRPAVGSMVSVRVQVAP